MAKHLLAGKDSYDLGIIAVHELHVLVEKNI